MTYTLDEKIGQMIMVGFKGATLTTGIRKKISTRQIGGVWLTDSASPMGDIPGNIKNRDQVKNLIRDLQKFADIPLFVSIDAEGGQVIRLKEKFGFPPIPSARELGRRNDPKQTYDAALKISSLLRSLGININFAPVVDMEIAPDNPAICGKDRCFSSHPEEVYQHARQFILAHRANNIYTCLKHFPGHGSTREDTHLTLADATESWQEKELFPYRKLIKEGLADTVLIAHILVKTLDEEFPASLSSKIIEQLLINELNFKGLVISDDLIMGAIRQHYSDEKAVELTLRAGTDILMNSAADQPQSLGCEPTFEIIKKLVTDNIISEARINRSFNKIIKFKRGIS